MKKSYVAVLVVVVLALLAGLAFADEPAPQAERPGCCERSKGPKKCDPALIMQFKQDTLEQRTKLAGAQAAMGALMRQENPDVSQARALAEEIFGLREQLLLKAMESGLPPFVVDEGLDFGPQGEGPGFGPAPPCPGFGPQAMGPGPF